MNIQSLKKDLHLPDKSKICSVVAIAAVSFSVSLPASASSLYNFKTIDFLGETETAVSSINNSGQLVGTFNDGESAFLFDGKEFTAFKPPGAGEVYIPGINDVGQIVGSFLMRKIFLAPISKKVIRTKLSITLPILQP